MPLRVHRDALTQPRVLIAGLRGGSGKTLVSLGLLAAWRGKGVSVAPFKKGPDYIDAAWLSRAARAECRNLDLFLMSPDTIARSFRAAAAPSDLAVIEGNRGLFDGMDAAGSCSTAELAKLLRAPTVLVVDCTKATRTIAALVLGCQRLDADVSLCGVILNRTGGGRHETVVREAVERSCGIPVLGSIPRLRGAGLFPERHLGLVPPQESGEVTASIDAAAEVVERFVDLDAVFEVANRAPELAPEPYSRASPTVAAGEGVRTVRIGVFRDSAFQFYYPENLEALVAEGACLVEVSPIQDAAVPQVDGLYIGGGFPETLAGALSDNGQFRRHVAELVEVGLPVYAECGGAVYLGESLRYGGREFPMVGVLPVEFLFDRRPRGHGYTELETAGSNPFYNVGERVRGHEFHHTYPAGPPGGGATFAFKVLKGCGFGSERDGLCRYNTLACYTHVHALGTPGWAPALVQAARRFASEAAVSAERQ